MPGDICILISRDTHHMVVTEVQSEAGKYGDKITIQTVEGNVSFQEIRPGKHGQGVLWYYVSLDTALDPRIVYGGIKGK
jgi:hypothetical protein